MLEELRLSDDERALILDLLERERSELPVEIHHTRSATVRGELHRRADLVGGLLDRLRMPVPV